MAKVLFYEIPSTSKSYPEYERLIQKIEGTDQSVLPIYILLGTGEEEQKISDEGEDGAYISTTKGLIELDLFENGLGLLAMTLLAIFRIRPAER